MGSGKARRRAALTVLAGLAVGAFAIGMARGGKTAIEPTIAATLAPPQLAGQRIVTGFSGTAAPAALAADIRRGLVAGVILFSENLPTPTTGRRLISDLQGIQRPPSLAAPLLVMIDQEGGLVKRLSGAPTASAEQMGARGAAFSRGQGRAAALNLRRVGVNVDLAPVLDVARPAGTIAETERGFGSTATEVAATAVPFAIGLQSGGVAATAKHFPGLGAARENTDFAVERIDLSKQTLRTVDEAPYRSFLDAGGSLVMLSTAIYPALSGRPAAFAKRIATGELRSRLGFDGVSITDAMESVAVRAFGGAAKAGVAAARAGTDLLLFADYRAAAKARRALIGQLRRDSLKRSGFELSVGRVIDLRQELSSSRSTSAARAAK